MIDKRNYFFFCLSLCLLPFFGSASSEKFPLTNDYSSICGDCIDDFDTVMAPDAFTNLEKFQNDIIPIIAAAEQLKDYEMLAQLYPRLRYAYVLKTDISNAIEVGLKCLRIPPKYLNEEVLIKEHGALSEYYSQLGLREEAYKHHLIASEGVLNTDNLQLKFRILFQSGTVFYFQKKYDESISFYKQALVLAQSSKDLEGFITFAISGLVSTYFEKGDFEMAKNYIEQQLERPLHPSVEAAAYQQFGDLLHQQSKIDSAEHYYQKALSIFQEISSNLNEAVIKNSLGEMALEQKELPRAIQLFSSILADTSLNNQEYLAKAYQGLATAYENQGDHKQAFRYQKAFSDIQPSLFQDSSSVKLDKLRMEFLLGKQEEEMNEMDHEKLVFARGAVFLLIVLIVVVGLLKMTRDAHKLTEQQKQQIQGQNEQLTDYNHRLKRFNSVVSHDLKQPLRTSLSMLGLFKRRYLKDLTNDGKEYLRLTDQSLNQMYKLIVGLLNLTQLEKPNEEDMDWVASSTPLVDAQSQLLVLINERKAEITISPSVDQWPAVYAYEAPITQLWQNLLANAIKFTPKDRVPKIEISTVEEKYQYVFSIKDNGIGIEEEYREKIFNMFNRLNDRNAYEGNGIGLATCKRIVDMHKGKIWVEGNTGSSTEQEESSGSTFFFTMPKGTKSIGRKEDRLMEVV